MIIACHQPNYLPHLGFFHKMKQADVFVILDSVQFSDGYYQHRNRVRTQTGWKWLTVPVERSFIPISEVRIKNNAQISRRPWQEYHWEIIQNTYNKTPHFASFQKELESIYRTQSFERLVDLNMALISFLRQTSAITTPLVHASVLGIEAEDASERLAKITAHLGGTVYLTGPSGGTKYDLHEEEFTKRGIRIINQEFHHPIYSQHHAKNESEFEKNLAAIDALFNVGKLPV